LTADVVVLYSGYTCALVFCEFQINDFRQFLLVIQCKVWDLFVNSLTVDVIACSPTSRLFVAVSARYCYAKGCCSTLIDTCFATLLMDSRSSVLKSLFYIWV